MKFLPGPYIPAANPGTCLQGPHCSSVLKLPLSVGKREQQKCTSQIFCQTTSSTCARVFCERPVRQIVFASPAAAMLNLLIVRV